MKIAIFIGIIIGLIAGIFVYDIAASLTHKNTPRFYVASDLFCKDGRTAITLPPFGIWICKNYFGNNLVREKELVLWNQYQKIGTVGFYTDLAYDWIMNGFSRAKNWIGEKI